LSSGRVSTGIPGLDGLIEGGFPRGSLILVAGSTGSGKTTFASEFVCKGVSIYDEAAVYATFAESRDMFVKNISKHLGRDCSRCVNGSRCRVLDFSAVKEEAVPLILDEILKSVKDMKAGRLVIDSFSAVAQSLKEKEETRILIHTTLNKIVKQMGCTTILISEVPMGIDVIGGGVEEFVADGLIILHRGERNGRPIREIEMPKMRGTRVEQYKYIFSLEGGFKVFPPSPSESFGRKHRFNPIPDTPEYFSTGNRNLDDVLGGGYRKGSMVLVEVDGKISYSQVNRLIAPTVANFLSLGRGVMVIPPGGVDVTYIVKTLTEDYGLRLEEVQRLIRAFRFTYGAPSIEASKGGGWISASILDILKGVYEGFKEWLMVEAELMRLTGGPTLHIVGLDSLTAVHKSEDVIKNMYLAGVKVREDKGLSIMICPPGVEKVKQMAINFADLHLKVEREHGVVMLYGVKGVRTPILCVEEFSRGYPAERFTPIV